MADLYPLDEIHKFFNKMIGNLVRFRNEIEAIEENGDLAHDKYLKDLKKLIDAELTSEKPDVAKVMEYMCLNRMKFELKGIE